MTLGLWLVLVAALLPVGLGLLWALLARGEPFDPGPDGFWRAPLRRTQYGLRVEPGLVHLHARAPRWVAFLGVLLLASAWLNGGREALRPFADDLPLPPPVRQALLRRPFDPISLAIGLVVFAFGAGHIVGSRRRTDVLLESQGDLRWHHRGWPQPEDGAVPVADLDELAVDRDGKVVLRFKDAARPPVTLFSLRALRRDEHVQDLRRATEAFRALAASRAG